MVDTNILVFLCNSKSAELEEHFKMHEPDVWDYGEIRANLEARGCLIGGSDMLIAAQARRRGLTVITNNTREYERVEGLKGQDWSR